MNNQSRTAQRIGGLRHRLFGAFHRRVHPDRKSAFHRRHRRRGRQVLPLPSGRRDGLCIRDRSRRDRVDLLSQLAATRTRPCEPRETAGVDRDRRRSGVRQRAPSNGGSDDRPGRQRPPSDDQRVAQTLNVLSSDAWVPVVVGLSNCDPRHRVRLPSRCRITAVVRLGLGRPRGARPRRPSRRDRLPRHSAVDARSRNRSTSLVDP